MGRRARDNRPQIKPVQKIQLSEGNTALRAIAAVLFLLIGAGALVYSVSQLFTYEPGWQAIEAGTADGPNCGEEFTLLYELGADGRPAREESRALNRLYTQACRSAFQLFHTVQSFEGVTNLHDINARPNEVLTVDEALYRAFEAVQRQGDRTIYLGPVYARYGDLFFCQDDSQTVEFDPWSSADVAEEYAAIAAYAADPGHIDVELLGEGRICLRVSEDYLAFAQEEGLERFLDFGWLKNAFVADYLADTLAQAGFTHGVLSSYDGFARCLDSRDLSYTLTLCGWEGSRPIEAAVVEYQGPMSVADLRAFPAGGGDWQRFYQMPDGTLYTTYLDVSDGRCRESVDSLTCWSKERSCAGLALAMAPVFIAGEFDPAPLEAMAGEGVHAVWLQERVFNGTDQPLELKNLYQNGTVKYSVSRS